MPAVTYEHIKTYKQSGARLGYRAHHTVHLKHLCLCQLVLKQPLKQ